MNDNLPEVLVRVQELASDPQQIAFLLLCQRHPRSYPGMCEQEIPQRKVALQTAEKLDMGRRQRIVECDLYLGNTIFSCQSRWINAVRLESFHST